MKKSLLLTLSFFALTSVHQSFAETGYTGNQRAYKSATNTAKAERRETKDFKARAKGKRAKPTGHDRHFRPELLRQGVYRDPQSIFLQERMIKELQLLRQQGIKTPAGVYDHTQHKQHQPHAPKEVHHHHHGSAQGVYQPQQATVSRADLLNRVLAGGGAAADYVPPPPPPQQPQPRQRALDPEQQRQMNAQAGSANAAANALAAVQEAARAQGLDPDQLSVADRLRLAREAARRQRAQQPPPAPPPPRS